MTSQKKPSPFTPLIESNILIPEKRQRQKTNYTYPWFNMHVGQSFAVGFQKESSVRLMATKVNKNSVFRFTCRRCYEDNVVRVWRTA